MAGYSRRFTTYVFAAILSGSAATHLLADDFTVTAPMNPGEDDITIVVKGASLVATVTIDKTVKTAAQKATAVAKAITDDDDLKKAGVSATASGDTVTIKGGDFGASKDKTGETDTSSFNPMAPNTGESVLVKVDLHLNPGFATLAGVNSTGGLATYNSGFTLSNASLGTVTLSSMLNFSQVTTPTLSGVLTQEFDTFHAQLQSQAPVLIGDLKLDLANESIDFLLPSHALGITSASITNGTTDVALYSTMDRANIPEPSSLVLAGIGSLLALGLVGIDRRRRRRPERS